MRDLAGVDRGMQAGITGLLCHSEMLLGDSSCKLVKYEARCTCHSREQNVLYLTCSPPRVTMTFFLNGLCAAVIMLGEVVAAGTECPVY